MTELREKLERDRKYFDKQCEKAQRLFLKTELMDDALFAPPEPDPEFGVRFAPAPERTHKTDARYFDSVLVQRVYGREVGDVLGARD